MGTRWHKQEPEKDLYDFSEYDRLMESAGNYGIKILPLIGHSAPWEFKNYAFTVDGDIVVAVWCNLPFSDIQLP
ncbi:MAG: hypothetical protein R6V04_13910 [bacterium]